MTKLYLLIAPVLFFGAIGCGRSALSDDSGGTIGAGDTAADLAPAITPPDMTDPGKSCGQVVQCLAGCGMQTQTCIQGCFSDVQAQALGEAGTVLFCAAKSCAKDLSAAQSNPLALLECLAQSCGSQLQACGGFQLPGL